MTAIPHRELRNESSRVLRAVQAGETFEVTNHGEVVAILSPPPAAAEQLRFRPATAHGGFATMTRSHLDHRIGQALDEMRAER